MLNRNGLCSAVLIFVSLACCSLIATGSGSVHYPDAGFSDDYLVKLGTAAESYLISRLREPKSQGSFAGIMTRLMSVGGMDTRNLSIISAAKEFLAANCRASVEDRDVEQAMAIALAIIGMRGGEEEVDYLLDWISKDKFTRQLRCYRGSGMDATYTKQYMRESAAEGLACNRSSRVPAALMEIRSHPPGVVNEKRFLRRIESLIQLNKKVREGGLNAAFPVRYNTNDVLHHLEKMGRDRHDK